MRDFKGQSAVADAPSRWLKVRVLLLGALFTLLLGGVFARAVQLQVFQREKLADMARDQYVRQFEIPARRGDIYDRRGVPLAQSVDVDSIWVDPQLLPDQKSASRALAKVLQLDAAELQARLARGKRFAWVKRQVRADQVQAVRALGLPGVGVSKEPRRFYPQRELAAHVVGLTGSDGRGLDGLELAFHDELSGQGAKVSGLRDARGRKLLMGGPADPHELKGAALHLTLDRSLQFVAEKALARAVDDAKATAGMAVVLDPKSGELLALANHPRFNPNSPKSLKPEKMRNRAALDLFEPGSTFKAFVVAAALEEKVITPKQSFFCENGAWPVGRHIVNDTHPYAWLDVTGILKVSSNICAAKIAQLLGRDRLSQTFADFGFGERAGLSLPGEGKGSLPYPKAEISLATQSYGQGLTATAVQLAAAYGALANGGKLMRPYLVSKVVDSDGLTLLENQPTEVRQVVSEATAQKVLSMLESVVEKDGTAPKARMDEYRVAGKTGTAQKADPVARGYSDERIASFIGVVPAENPRAVILIVIDEPKTDVYGGLVAAPAFKEIAQAAMPYLGVPPSREAEAPAPSAARAAKVPSRPLEIEPSGALFRAFAKAAAPDVVTEPLGEGSVVVPDLVGVSSRTAVQKALGAALSPRLSGSGRVIAQEPRAGTRVDKGSKLHLTLASQLPSNAPILGEVAVQ